VKSYSNLGKQKKNHVKVIQVKFNMLENDHIHLGDSPSLKQNQMKAHENLEIHEAVDKKLKQYDTGLSNYKTQAWLASQFPLLAKLS